MHCKTEYNENVLTNLQHAMLRTSASSHTLSSQAPAARCKVSILNLNHFRIVKNLLFYI